MRQLKLASRIDGIEESATLALNARVKQLAVEGKTIYNLTAGELACETPAFIQAAVAKTLHLNKYTPVAGLPELRQKIAAHARDFYQADWIQPANVVVTAGVKPALYASLLALVNPGDEVIVPSPAWVSYKHLIELVGGTMIETPLTDTFDLDPSTIADHITPKTKLVIINSPHNPTGAVFSDGALRELAERLKTTDIVVIADDIYTKLVFEDCTPLSTYGFNHLVIVNGFSKSQALTGWRIGYLIADEAVAAAVAKVLSHIMGNAAVPSQHAGLAALSHGDKPVMLDVLRVQRALVESGLRAIPKLKYTLPRGAFYFFIDIRAITKDSLSWCEQLLDETGVALVPGEAFGAPGFVRLSFVTDDAVLKSALRHIKQFVEKGPA